MMMDGRGGSRRRALKKFRFCCVVEDVADEIRIDQLIVGSPNVRLFGWCWWTARGRRKKMHRDRPFFFGNFYNNNNNIRSLFIEMMNEPASYK